MIFELSVCLMALVSCFGSEHLEKNVALEAKVRQVCDDDFYNESMLTDGQIDPSSYVIVEIICDKSDLFVKLLLEDKVHVSHVIVYSGNCDKCNGWDYFNVRLSSNLEDSSESCGNYPKIFGKKPMRVNCMRTQVIEKYDVVEVKQHNRHSKKIAAVSEIEVFQFGDYPQGCYRHVNGSLYPNATTAEECKSTCYSNGLIFSAITSGVCHCLEHFPQSQAECGDNTHHVYAARLPWIVFYGCYNPPRGSGYVNWTSDNMTLIKCIIFCSENRKMFSYLKDSDECLCDESKPNLTMETDLLHCSSECAGSDDMCGGEDVGSLYTGCFEDRMNISCTEVYRCENDDIDIFGQCQGSCSPGWGGPHCASHEVFVTTTQTADDTFRESHCIEARSVKSSIMIFMAITVYHLH